jgi:peptidoglycan/LPS O-acetylase OafA/YrhL
MTANLYIFAFASNSGVDKFHWENSNFCAAKQADRFLNRFGCTKQRNEWTEFVDNRTNATMQSNHQPYLDGWRGLAVLFLLIGHFYPVPGINFGAVGVNLFFVLSGLLMSRLLFVKHVPLPIFYRRRIARIFPVAFSFILIWTSIYMFGDMEMSWRDVLAASTFTNNYFLAAPTSALPFQHFWSLSVEEHSYVVLSLLAIGVRKNIISSRAALLGCTAVTVFFLIFYSVSFVNPRLFELWRHTEVAAFGIFCSAFVLLCVEKRTSFYMPGWIAPILLLIGIACHWWVVPQPLRTILGVGAMAMAVNFLPNAAGWVQAGFAFYPLRLIGLWSYSIYVWQQPFHIFVEAHKIPAHVGLGISLVCGVASYYLLEQPVRKYLNKVWHGQLPGAIIPAINQKS